MPLGDASYDREDWYETFNEIRSALYEDMHVAVNDEYGIEKLYDGWFNAELEYDERMEAREAFLEYYALENEQFDWDDWRDWYDAA